MEPEQAGFDRAVEMATGMTADAIRNMPLDQFRKDVEDRRGGALRYRSVFPLVGRGNVLRDRLKTHHEVEEEFRRAVRG
ncbi:MAG TPA: hypothetical protein P5137_02295 [Candidatus Brocadiia bacterium]|nr:hypothetical protein [Candidatus Brocadiia bacterium]